jgi:hypothetical protein
LRSPLLHFLVLGALLFLLSEVRAYRADEHSTPAPRIEIGPDRIDLLAREFQSQMGRRPDAGELDRLIAREAEEEMLFQEALSRGLLERDGGVQTRMIQKMLFLDGATRVEDAGSPLARAIELELHRDDVVVRRILVQKMKLFGSQLDTDEAPTAEDIAARYAETREELREPDRISFRQIFLSADDRKGAAQGDASNLMTRLSVDPADVDASLALGDVFPLGQRFENKSERDLARSFGAGFGKRVLDLEPGRWSEPIESAYGWHLVWLDARDDGEIPPLESVTDRIRRSLEREFQQAKLERLLGELQNRYHVVVADTPTASAPERTPSSAKPEDRG